jgi:hypothetical protein
MTFEDAAKIIAEVNRSETVYFTRCPDGSVTVIADGQFTIDELNAINDYAKALRDNSALLLDTWVSA